MSEPVVIALIAAAPGIIAAVLVWLKSQQAIKAVQEIHVLLNDRLSKMLELTASVAHRAGEDAEKARQQQRGGAP